MAVIEERRYTKIASDGAEKVKRRFKATINVRGFPRISKTFDRKTDAATWAQKTEYEMRHQLDFGSVASKNKKLSEAIDRYLAF